MDREPWTTDYGLCLCLLSRSEELTLTGGEGGAPGVSSHTHHQRISHQSVAFITLKLYSTPSVQVVLLHFAIEYLFGAYTASSCWK